MKIRDAITFLESLERFMGERHPEINAKDVEIAWAFWDEDDILSQQQNAGVVDPETGLLPGDSMTAPVRPLTREEAREIIRDLHSIMIETIADAVVLEIKGLILKKLKK